MTVTPKSKPFAHDLQRELDRNIPLELKLRLIHEAIGNHSILTHRVAVALYDINTDMLSTYLTTLEGDVRPDEGCGPSAEKAMSTCFAAMQHKH